MGYLEILAAEIQNLTFIEAEKEFSKRKVLLGENQFKTLKLMTSDVILNYMERQ